jgi:hypothetical protein
MVLATLRARQGEPIIGPETISSEESPKLDRNWYSPCWLNGRRYLKPFTGPPTLPSQFYVPICQSFAPVIFESISDLRLSPMASKVETKEMLVKTCKMATAEYGKIRERKSMLPESILLMEDIGASMWKYVLFPSLLGRSGT